VDQPHRLEPTPPMHLTRKKIQRQSPCLFASFTSCLKCLVLFRPLLTQPKEKHNETKLHFWLCKIHILLQPSTTGPGSLQSLTKTIPPVRNGVLICNQRGQIQTCVDIWLLALGLLTNKPTDLKILTAKCASISGIFKCLSLFPPTYTALEMHHRRNKAKTR
jgi:hypothetical protein